MTDEIKIEKGVPAPPYNKRQRLPLDKMDVGDSFVCSYVGKSSPVNAYKAYIHRKQNGKKFTSRKISKDGEITTYRVWRVE